ncbi:putative malic enzyme [Hibiscus syriacus]|uniref:Malic enzyme n=1 Tax=Hibiscus syriacus TaxID=106335 RepID=A0A6A2WRR9_HIBSY|nr:transcription factor MYBS3-like [Hibiscus syriacus]KAE8663001.1 putative malic enzyme [Hibiscus syriacus]
MTRRCSHCSNNGHNSRTCPTRGDGGISGGGVKLFGVRLTDGSIIKKSASMGNLSSAHYHSSSSAAVSPNHDSPLSDHVRDHNHDPDGYLSDDPAAHFSTNRRGDRKKGTPWTEEEHRLFLVGLHKLGKGDWRGIARNFVVSRTPTQVASHAQKYFIRQSNFSRRKRRSSLFDMVPDDMDTDTLTVPEEHVLPPSSQVEEADNANSIPSLNLSLNSEFEHGEDAAAQGGVKETEETMMRSSGITPMVHGFFPPYVPVPYPFWPPNPAPPNEDKGIEASQHQVLKPIPLLPKEPVNVDEVVGMSRLSIGGAENGHREPSPLSLKLLGEPSRQSAFHANAQPGGRDLSNGKTSAIEAVLL